MSASLWLYRAETGELCWSYGGRKDRMHTEPWASEWKPTSPPSLKTLPGAETNSEEPSPQVSPRFLSAPTATSLGLNKKNRIEKGGSLS